MNEIQASEEAKRKAIERANAYRAMMSMWAWKDLMGLMQKEREQRIEKLLIGADDLKVIQGFMAALRCMNDEIGYILNDGGINATQG